MNSLEFSVIRCGFVGAISLAGPTLWQDESGNEISGPQHMCFRFSFYRIIGPIMRPVL